MSESESSSSSVGMSSFDFEGLSPLERTIVRVLLRRREATAADLMPLVAIYDDTFTAPMINDALHDLVEKMRISVLDSEPIKYKVNMRRKQTGTLRRTIWDAVSDEAASANNDELLRKRQQQRSRAKSVWDSLDDLPQRDKPDFSDQGQSDSDERG